MKTIELIDGYSRSKNPTRSTFRVVEFDEVISWTKPKKYASRCMCGHLGDYAGSPHVDTLQTGHGPCKVPQCPCMQFTWRESMLRDITPSHVWFIANDGRARQAKVNGKVRTWKRDPRRVELPLKYGMYEYVTFDTNDIESGRLLLPV